MRLFSTAALSLALAATSGLVMPGASFAQKKDAAAPAKIQASQGFFKVAKPLQDLLNAKNFDGATAMMPDAEKAATTPDDRYFVGNFWLNIGIGKQDQATQLKGVELMLDSGKVSPADQIKMHTAAGGLSVNLNNVEGGRKHYAAALQAGADVAQTEALIAETYFGPAYATLSGNHLSAAGRELAIQGLPHLRTAIDAQTKAGTPPPANWYDRGLQTAVVAQAPDAFEWAKITLPKSNNLNSWRLTLLMFQDSYKDLPRPANIDLMRLMFDNKTLQNDYNYADFVEALWKSGQPGEVKSVIDTATAAGAIKQDRFSDIYKLASDAIAKDKAGLAASATAAASAANGKPASRTADAYLGYGENAKAIELYKLALQKGGVDNDEVNTRIGIALLRSGDTAGAKEAFAAVKDTGARGQIAQLWSVWADLKGKAA